MKKNIKIRLVTKMNGRKQVDKIARPGVDLEDVLELAENEVMDGYADYSAVYVDGRLYAEYES